jgi:hypothetical protein
MHSDPNSERKWHCGMLGFGRKCKKLPTNVSVCNGFFFWKVHSLRDPNPGPRLLLVMVFLVVPANRPVNEWRVPAFG